MIGTFLSVGNVLQTVLFSIIALILGTGLGILLFREFYKKTGRTATKIIEDAKKEAEKNRKEEIVNTKQEIHVLKQEAEKEICQFKFDSDKEISLPTEERVVMVKIGNNPTIKIMKM